MRARELEMRFVLCSRVMVRSTFPPIVMIDTWKNEMVRVVLDVTRFLFENFSSRFGSRLGEGPRLAGIALGVSFREKIKIVKDCRVNLSTWQHIGGRILEDVARDVSGAITHTKKPTFLRQRNASGQ